MISENVLDRTAHKRHASMQSLTLLEEYPLLQSWLSDMFIKSYTEESFNAYSRLTSKGLPVEYAVVWPSCSVRCTTDVLPNGTLQQRIKKTLQMAGPFNYIFQQDIATDLLNNQDDQDLRYGAWLGVREEQQIISTKVYLEIAGSHKPLFLEVLGISFDYLTSLGIRPVIAGLPVSRGGVEIYFKLAQLDRNFLRWLLGYFNFPDRTRDIFKMLEELCGQTFSGSVFWSSIGFSVTWSAEMKVESVTVYSFASSAIGSDQMVREHVLKLGQKHNWDMGLYEKLSDGATGTTDLNTFHGMVGVVAGIQGEVYFTVGVSPVSNDLL
jgi:hypothetical protein